MEIENAASANVSDESRSDVNNTSEIQQGFATSSLREGWQGGLQNVNQLSVQELKDFHLCFRSFQVILSQLQIQVMIVHHYQPNLLQPTSLFQGESLFQQKPLGEVISARL